MRFGWRRLYLRRANIRVGDADVNTTFFEGSFGRIAYHQSDGSGPAVFLIHGNSASARSFARQFNGPLGQRFRLIAIDLPGHGYSANATDPTVYSLPGYARVVTDIVERLGVGNAVFVGWSLGGHTILEAAPDLPKAAGLMIFGTPPLAFPPAMEQAFLPNPAMAAGFTPGLSAQQAQAYVEAGFRPGATGIPSSFLEDVRRTDGRARAQLATRTVPGGFRDEVELVARLTTPLAVLHGAEEQLVNGSYFATLSMPTLWRGAVQTIAGSGHTPQWEQAAQFDALLAAFIDDTR